MATPAGLRPIGCLQQIRCTVAKHELRTERKSLQNDIKAFTVGMGKSQPYAEPFLANLLPTMGRIDAERRAAAVTHLSLVCCRFTNSAMVFTTRLGGQHP